jgi:hypothetical protein
MSNVDFKDNVICKYTISIIIWSISFVLLNLQIILSRLLQLLKIIWQIDKF